jgi:hypothetical protein
MIALSFALGVLVGALGLTALWLHYVDRQEPEATQHGISAIGVSLDGKNGPRLDPFIVKKLEDVLPELKRWA